MTPEHIKLAITIRSLVAALGEKHGWWRSSFLSPTGLNFLRRIYPRTYVAAGIRSASEAGRIEHDARIGRGQVVHLFRLPAALEQAIDDSVRAWGLDDQEKIGGVLISVDGPMTGLRRLADGKQPSGREGPVVCGNVAGLRDVQTLALVAAEYFHGFETGIRIYPYFEVGK